MLTREQVLGYTAATYREVEVFGGVVRIKPMSIRDQMEFEDYLTDKNKDALFYAIIKCCVDEQGNSLFQLSDMDALKDLPASEVIKLNNAIIEINHLKRNSDEKLAKN